MGNYKFVVKATEKDRTLVVESVLEYAEELFIKRIFLYAVMVVKTCLSAPADVECARDVRLAPLHYLAKLIPIFYLLKFDLLNGSTRDYHSVKISMLYFIEGLDERFGRKVARVIVK